MKIWVGMRTPSIVKIRNSLKIRHCCFYLCFLTKHSDNVGSHFTV